jgi:hypothetical protein
MNTPKLEVFEWEADHNDQSPYNLWPQPEGSYPSPALLLSGYNRWDAIELTDRAQIDDLVKRLVAAREALFPAD